MKTKFYRAKKDTPTLAAGAVLKSVDSDTYEVVNDLYVTKESPGGKNQYAAYRIEDNEEWFERVYEVNLLTKTVYKGLAEARELFAKTMTE